MQICMIFFREGLYFGDISSSDDVKLDIVKYLVRKNENFYMLYKLEIKKNNAIRVTITTPIKRMLNGK